MLQKLTQLESADHWRSNSGIPHPMQISLPRGSVDLVCIRAHAFPRSQDVAQLRKLIGMGKLQYVAGEIWGWKICLGASLAAIPLF
jgi:hypothetical protein